MHPPSEPRATPRDKRALGLRPHVMAPNRPPRLSPRGGALENQFYEFASIDQGNEKTGLLRRYASGSEERNVNSP